MRLSGIDLKNYGYFTEDTPASFKINNINVPSSWEYIYQNGEILAKVDQFGVYYAQAYPPSDIVLLNRPKFYKYSEWFVWFNSPQFKNGPFTNFYKPNASCKNPLEKPDRYEVTYHPQKAVYILENEGIRVTTEIFVTCKNPNLCQRITIKNLTDRKISLKAFSVLRPMCMWGKMAPWDKPEWYMRTALFKDEDERVGFSTHVTSPICDISKRRAVVFWSEQKDLKNAEISYEKFVGTGDYQNPQSVFDNKLNIQIKDEFKWSEYKEDNNIFGYSPIYALQYDYIIEPGEEESLRQVYSMIPTDKNGNLPPIEIARTSAIYLSDSKIEEELNNLKNKYQKLFNARIIETPDEDLNKYVNEWLPLQLEWVCSVDRGWPSGMRGGRDAANDFTAIVPLNPDWVRELILTELSCQLIDGRIPRHFSARGHEGEERDYRITVDAGTCVVEMIYTYLAYTKDFDLLKEEIPWLDYDKNKKNSVLEHLFKAIEYYILPENIGEHGLAKVREGGWLDSANRLGMKGRGEAVMLTGQVILSLMQAKEILIKLYERNLIDNSQKEYLMEVYSTKIKMFTEALRKHALNSKGYYNGFFNDDGKWIFSLNDPDGKERIYAPATYWAIIAGVVKDNEIEKCLKILDTLKCSNGYRLCWPPFKYGTIDNVGRMASGDSPAGRSEHANPYSHGSHGFLGRALAVAGKGDLLRHAIDCILPYSQDLHPVKDTMAPPYAVTNVWEDIPSFKGRAKDLFLTGSIAYAYRMVYEWMLGIKPNLEGMVIDPCLPSTYKNLNVKMKYMQKQLSINYLNKDGNNSGVRKITLNGKVITETVTDLFSRRKAFLIKDEQFDDEVNHITVEL